MCAVVVFVVSSGRTCASNSSCILSAISACLIMVLLLRTNSVSRTLQTTITCKATMVMLPFEMFLFCSASLLPQPCFSLSDFMLNSHNIVSSSFMFPSSTQSHCFSQARHYPNWDVCSRALTITSLRKCQLSLASSLSSLPWKLSSSRFLHLFILTYTVLLDVLSEKFCACPGGILFHYYSHKLKRKSRHMIKKCKSFACLR